ncbi:sugar transferase [Butyrivibrio sp. YAB3001]|uniref:sugar transferase n=1 Tax=Butyrivibrio sp. YAB3001 TaxID=1520812 RepID=UPI0008F66EC0|nr:sugar transferase [Butyrivibrio sp. YAB3001]SFB84375.1 exopolysaccharide biosynthesis polyprenyl glycosylphosphotransferase [Butyrivibrio sp. YAB3001]
MNRSNTGASFDILHVLLDSFILIVSFGITYLICGDYGFSREDWKAVVSLYIVCIFIFLLVNRTENIYNNTIFFYMDRIIRRETLSFIAATVSGVIVLFNSMSVDIYMPFLVYLALISYALIIFENVFFRRIVDRIVMRKHVPRVLYVGSKDSYNKFRYFLNKTPLQINEIGYISFDDDDKSIEYIGKLTELPQLIRKYNIDQVYILQKREMNIKYLQRYVDICIEMGVTCRIVIDTFRRRKSYSYVSSIGTYPVYTFHTVTMNWTSMVIKRTFDIVFSLFAIILTSPIMIITAIAIKLDSPGPAIFKQVRVGKNGRHFKIWKFRSMRQDAEEMKKDLEKQNEMHGNMMFKMKDDPRITKVGHFIRKTSIDELPQFFNVLFGSMSVVGTRPPTKDEVEKYSVRQWRRISIKPGITGMWQVSGRSSITDFSEVVELDTKYIDNWSTWLDIKIIFKTVAQVLARKGSF